MGADLYIKSITEPAIAKYNPLFYAAVRKRDSLCEHRDRVQTVLAVYQPALKHGVPSAKAQVATLTQKLARIRKSIEAAQAEVDRYYNRMYPDAGYFRDSYNGSSVLWRLKLSWWKDAKGGKQTVKSLERLVHKIESRRLPPVTVAELKEMGCSVDDNENSPKVWAKLWRNKKRRLVRFLKRAACHVALGEEVYFSV